MRVFSLRHQAEEVDDIDETNLQIRAVLAQNCGSSERFGSRNISGAGHDDIRLGPCIGRCPVPDSDAFGAVLDGLVHVEELQMRSLVGNDDVDVVRAAQAVICDTEQAVCIRRKIDARDVRALIGDDVDEAGILVSEAVVVLTPDQRRDQEVDGGDGRAPAQHLGF